MPHSPRPLPLFLALVRQEGANDPVLARKALAGLDRYASAARIARDPPRPVAASIGGAALRDHGGNGQPLLLVPSLINPPHILDLDRDTSLAAALTANRRVLLLDWGRASERAGLSIAGHIESILVPLIKQLGAPPALLGYCLGGTMAIAAASLTPVDRLATLAAPWHFAAYSNQSRAALARIWDGARGPSASLGALPMEVLQAAFWALDPARTVAKFAAFADLDPASDEARRFIMLEDWANEGEPLPLPAAHELVEDLFGADLPGSEHWIVGGRQTVEQPSVAALHLIAASDHIVPARTAPAGTVATIASGHVGMIVGRARHALHAELNAFLKD
ncbi:MAG: alpha/beta hydrolase [Sphingomonas bacterium]|nr:alpha/beta hydrolase [Sphingomonas bacterium]